MTNKTTQTTVKLTKIFAGLYTCELYGKTYEVSRNDERGTSWTGMWIIRGNGNYSDPIATLRDCKAALQDMQDNPQTYEIGPYDPAVVRAEQWYKECEARIAANEKFYAEKNAAARMESIKAYIASRRK